MVARLQWFKENRHRYFFGQNSNLEAWNTDFDLRAKNFVPSKFITNRIAIVKVDLDVTNGGRHCLIDRVNLIIKLPTKSSL